MDASNNNRSGPALNGTGHHMAPADVDFSLVRGVESRLVRARAALLKESDQAFSGLAVSTNEAAVLTAIGKSVANSPTGLSEVLGVNSGFMSRLLNRLENKSLLQRSQSTGDRRVVKIALTEAGARMYIRLEQIMPNLLNRRFGRLSHVELVELNGLLERLIGE
ncbi:MarR family winged helix-turn-helix transcriptional regulator [Paraburkholderia dipogonis]|uniref:MarR family winged helix-turn-helix transcriptional regulator n=1 Tax=Paraburkholderia dipogonis TaxID=1211383 RepID=UPI0038B91C74